MDIKTSRLKIRNLKTSDAKALLEIKYDKMVHKYNRTLIKKDATHKDAIEYIEFCDRLKDKGDFDKEVYFAIELIEDESLIGVLTISKMDYLDELQIGWMLLSKYTGCGYASEAGKAFSDYILAKYDYEYLVVVMDIDNPASFRTAQKSGFKLFEQRSAYDYHYSKVNVESHQEVLEYYSRKANKIGSSYFYFRKYKADSKIEYKFYGDKVYEGRFA